MTKKYKEIVINNCYGGFGLSDEAYEQLIKWGIPVKKYNSTDDYKEEKVIYNRELNGEDTFFNRYWEVWINDERENPLLLKVIKKLGKKANSRFSDLKIVKIPADIEYEIEEYDGMEHIAEVHQTWS